MLMPVAAKPRCLGQRSRLAVGKRSAGEKRSSVTTAGHLPVRLTLHLMDIRLRKLLRSARSGFTGYPSNSAFESCAFVQCARCTSKTSGSHISTLQCLAPRPMSLLTQMVAARRRARAAADESVKRRRMSGDAEATHTSARQDMPDEPGAAAAPQAAATPVALSIKSFYGEEAASTSAVELRLQRFLGHVRQRLDTADHTYETFPLQEQAFNFADTHEAGDLIR